MSEETLGHMMIRELQEEKATLRARVADLEAAREAMLAVCTDADPHDRTYPYVCLAESGNPIIEAATLADAIRQLARWGDAGYAKAAKAEAQLATARAEERERLRDAIESLRKAMSMRHSTDGWPPPLSMSERVALHRLENMVKSPCLTPEPLRD